MNVQPSLKPAALALLGLICGPITLAQADGMPRTRGYAPYAEPVYQPYNWSGLYFGGHLGGAHVSTEWAAGPLEPIDQSSGSFVGGGQVGFQKQWEKIVLGVEAAYTWIEAEQSTNSTVVVGTTRSSDVTNLFTVAGRLGFVHENMLAYVKGGYASADIEFRTATAAGVAASTSEREGGWIAGLGLDYGLTPNISIGVEYNYIRLSAGGSTTAAVPVSDADIDIQSVMGRLNFKFGPRAEAVPMK